MPISGTPVTPPGTADGLQPVSLDEVRMFMRDVAGQVPGTGTFNTMFDLPEFSDPDITRAIRFTVARYQVIPPLLNINITATTMNPWLLLIGTTAFLCMSEAFRQNRNQITYPDNERPIGLDDKVQQYNAMAEILNKEFEDKTKAYKVSLNAESAWGSLGSGYRNVSRFAHSS